MYGNSRALDDRFTVPDSGIHDNPRHQPDHQSLPWRNVVPSNNCVTTSIDRAVALGSEDKFRLSKFRPFKAAKTAVDT